jgi:acetamidase/formamidase
VTKHRIKRDDDRAVHFAWDPAIPPVLTVSSGDVVVFEARSGDDDQILRGSTTEDLDRFDMQRLHALCGPVAVSGAEPGGALVVEILELEPAPWAFTMMRPGAGFLTDFSSWLKTYPIDRDRNVIEFAPGIDVPLTPFLGQMGVAPPDGPRRTIPPGSFGGNVDCREAVAGTTLRLPVFVPGARFSCGDGHAAQGDGEVCLTAAECAMTAHLRFGVEPVSWLKTPLLETPAEWMTYGAGATIEEAGGEALNAMLDLVSRATGLDRPSAYALASLGVDMRINQLVNRPAVGVRAAIRKELLPYDSAQRIVS